MSKHRIITNGNKVVIFNKKHIVGVDIFKNHEDILTCQIHFINRYEETIQGEEFIRNILEDIYGDPEVADIAFNRLANVKQKTENKPFYR